MKQIQILEDDRLDKRTLIQLMFNKYSFQEFQSKITPQHSQYYNGDYPPIWVKIDKIEGDTLFFYYASEVEENGKPKPPVVGKERHPHTIKRGVLPGNVEEAAWDEINFIFSLVGTVRPVFMQIVTTFNRVHTWHHAYWVHAHQAIEHVFKQNSRRS